jgi:hypothetical protein
MGLELFTWRTLMVLLKAGKNLGSGILVKYWQAQRFYQKKQKLKWEPYWRRKEPIMKAKLIYDYVQQKSRYVSIQVGIGGWKPMDASDVDRLGYGDCKGLTNYTKALWRQ